MLLLLLTNDTFHMTSMITDSIVLSRYSFYDHIVCTRFLPVGTAVQGTLRLRDKNFSIDYGDGLKIGFGCFADKVGH